MQQLQDRYTYLLAFGSSIGDREAFLKSGVKCLQEKTNGTILDISSIYVTDPIGPAKNSFYNGCLVFECLQSPAELLQTIMEVEAENQRTREIRWDDRTLDIDILLFKEPVETATLPHFCEPGLSIPHPRMLDRDFVLVPASEVAADWVHPVYRMRLDEICKRKDYQLEHKANLNWNSESLSKRISVKNHLQQMVPQNQDGKLSYTSTNSN